jgi:hypothetical protein
MYGSGLVGMREEEGVMKICVRLKVGLLLGKLSS